MSVKSTQRLTRDEAVERYVQLKLDSEKLKRKYRAKAIAMDNTTLENKLEKIDDENCGGESCRNYSIGEPWGT